MPLITDDQVNNVVGNKGDHIAWTPVPNSAKVETLNEHNWNNLNEGTITGWLKNNRSSAYDEKLINYYLSEQSAQTARKYDEYMDSTRYQRMVEDLKSAGLNPYWLLNNASAGSVQSNGGNNYGGSQSTSRSNNETNNFAKLGSILVGLLAAMAYFS